MRFQTEFRITLEELAAITGGVPLGDKKALLPSVICTNSEEVQGGDCFVAIRGESFDGNCFLNRAALHGASMLIAREVPAFPHPPTLLIGDTVEALLAMAKRYYHGLSLQTVAVTGSVGKTSTVCAIRKILSQRYRVHTPEGNRNNALGIAVTMLETPKKAEVAVFEIGSNHPGEVAPLSRLLRPDLAVVTAVGRAHVGNFGSEDAILREKLSISEGLRAGGILLLPQEIREKAPKSANPRTFSLTERGDFCFSHISSEEEKTEFLFSSPNRSALPCRVLGRGVPLLSAALIALSVGEELSLTAEELERGAQCLSLPRGRGELRAIGGLRLFDDGYNASPESVHNAFLRLAEEEPTPARRIALLGDMLELGTLANVYHEEMGDRFAKICGGRLFLFGKYALRTAAGAARGGLSPQSITVFPASSDTGELAQRLFSFLKDGDTVLIKGSHATKAEEIFKKLTLLLDQKAR